MPKKKKNRPLVYLGKAKDLEQQWEGVTLAGAFFAPSPADLSACLLPVLLLIFLNGNMHLRLPVCYSINGVDSHSKKSTLLFFFLHLSSTLLKPVILQFSFLTLQFFFKIEPFSCILISHI